MKLHSVFKAILDEYKGYTDKERKQVVLSGGLHIIGTERHVSRRIDDKLRGRSGRQGDPGSSRFFLSLEDHIFCIFGGGCLQGLIDTFGVEDRPLESKVLTRALDALQQKAENYFCEIRKQLCDYDQVLNSQRVHVYKERKRALQSENLQNLLKEYVQLTMDDLIEANIDPGASRKCWDLEMLISKLKEYCYLFNDLTPDLLQSKCSNYIELCEYLHFCGCQVYLAKREKLEKQMPGVMEEAERHLILRTIDVLWKEHLKTLKFLQKTVALRVYAQKDPLTEYKIDGYKLFVEMMAQIRRNVVYSIFQESLMSAY